MKQPPAATERRQTCVIGYALQQVPEGYKPALWDIVHRVYVYGGLTADDAALAMRQAGLRSSASAITRHRRGTCACEGRQGDE